MAKLPLALCVSQTESYFLIHSLFYIIIPQSCFLFYFFCTFSLQNDIIASIGSLWLGMSLQRAKFSRNLGECGRERDEGREGGRERVGEREAAKSVLVHWELHAWLFSAPASTLMSSNSYLVTVATQIYNTSEQTWHHLVSILLFQNTLLLYILYTLFSWTDMMIVNNE